MSLGNGVLVDNVYNFPVLKNQFFIEYDDGKYLILKKDSSGVLSIISIKNTIQHAKDYLVNYINKNRKLDFPNLTL